MEQGTRKTTNPLLAFFLIAFSFSWFFWSFGVLDGMKIITLPVTTFVFSVVGAHGPLVAALIMTGRVEGWPGIKSLLKSGFNLRIPLVWWLLILLLPAILGAVTLWANVALNDFKFDNSLLAQPWMIPPMFVAMFFIGGSIQEEFGWRGFALPRLLNKWNPLKASLILGAIWGIWHLPLFLIPDTGQYYMPLGVFLILVEAFSVLITWAYIRTKLSLFSALLFHTSINTMLSVFPSIEKVPGGSQVGFVYLTIGYVIVSLSVIVIESKLFSS